MRGNIILFFSLMFTVTIYSQVGIGTVNPTKDLDVNGEVRIRVLPETPSNPAYLLTTDGSGNISKAKYGTLCSGNQISSTGFDLSNKRADDGDFACLYVVKSGGRFKLPKGPTAVNTGNFYTLKVYFKGPYLDVDANTDNGYIMRNPCGNYSSGNTCRKMSYYHANDGTYRTTRLSSSFASGSSYNNVNKVIEFVWFDGFWHFSAD